MSKIEDGGPAFPFCVKGQTTAPEFYYGMTLRDYFAAKAMQSVWAEIPEDANRKHALEHLGRAAYEMADAMLRAREQS